MSDETGRNNSSWGFDRRIPLSLLVVLAVQTGSLIWWASNIEFRTSNSERRIEILEQNNSDTSREIRNLSERMIRLDASLSSINDSVKDLNKGLSGIQVYGYKKNKD